MSIFRAADPLFGFGQHPKLAYSRERYIRSQRKKGFEAYALSHAGRPIALKELRDPSHPSVTLIPRDQFLDVCHNDIEPIGIERHQIYFSSHDFYVNDEDGWVFQSLSNAPFWRLGDIPQLGYLTPSPEEDEVAYLASMFPHTRWSHSLVAAALAEVILARNGFTAQRRAPIILTVGTHDIATPIGGDAIKSIDPKLLDEEANYTWLMRHYKFDQAWKKKFGFHVEVAAHWVKNHGVVGRFLDVVDRLSYVMLDCYFIGSTQDGRIRQFCLKHPLFMDVWNDIVFSNDKKQFGFKDPERVYHFLFARALEHVEILHNPKSKLIDLCMAHLVKPLYESGKITKEQLLTMTKYEFYYFLSQHYPPRRLNPGLINLNSLLARRFETQDEADAFASTLPSVFYREYKRGFNTGLDWPIATDAECNHVGPLRDFLSKAQTELLQSFSNEVRGYYVYWRTSPKE